MRTALWKSPATDSNGEARVKTAYAPTCSTGRIELLKVTFEGSRQVSDPDALRHILCNGVGRAKGYGCGLITLAPI
jgi:CRISPR associated protein